MVAEINGNVFDDKIKGACLVDFFATWCPPCKMLAPVVDKVAKEYENKLNFYKINVDNNIDIAKKYQIMSVPTLIVFRDGRPVKKASGVMSESELKNFIN
ncbi:MAG: thioredoxin [Firmicutes bacterium]|nr:thioredoxin [Bacillota bacterium]